MMRKDINVCPKCGNVNLKPAEVVIPANGYGIIPVNKMHRCKKCGYQGLCPIIEESKLDSFRKELNKSKK